MHMEEALAEFLRHLALEKNASAHTVKSYREDLTQALDFFRTRLGNQTPRPEQLTTRLLRAHLAWLSEQGYARSTIARRLAAIRSWCRFLCRQGTLTANPAMGLRGPRRTKAAALRLARGHGALAGDAAGRARRWDCATAPSWKRCTRPDCASAN